jgi:hypothetical protein
LEADEIDVRHIEHRRKALQPHGPVDIVVMSRVAGPHHADAAPASRQELAPEPNVAVCRRDVRHGRRDRCGFSAEGERQAQQRTMRVEGRQGLATRYHGIDAVEVFQQANQLALHFKNDLGALP